jgi:hypothetical protein
MLYVNRFAKKNMLYANKYVIKILRMEVELS